MGYRTINLPLDEVPNTAVTAWAEALVDFARWYGFGASWAATAGDLGVCLEIELGGNSSHLNRMTPLISEAAGQIAHDISPGGQLLADHADEVGRQLTEQLISWDGVPHVTFTRSGREAEERLGGEASVAAFLREVDLHSSRISLDLRALTDASGPNGWRERLDAHFAIRVDAASVITCVRKIERVARDLHRRLNDSHLRAALTAFDASTSGVREIRNILEHIDEYVIGSGRLDHGVPTEPGPALEVDLENNDVVLSARGRRVKVNDVVVAARTLGKCIDAAGSIRLIELHFPGGIDFDLIRVNDDGSRTAVDSTDPEQQQIKAVFTQARARVAALNLPPVNHGDCGTCGLPL